MVKRGRHQEKGKVGRGGGGVDTPVPTHKPSKDDGSELHLGSLQRKAQVWIYMYMCIHSLSRSPGGHPAGLFPTERVQSSY